MEVYRYGLSRECYECNIRRYFENVTITGEEKKAYQERQWAKIKAAPENIGSDEFFKILEEEYSKVAPIVDYMPLKEHFNQLMMEIAPDLEKDIQNSADPLLYATKLAFAANYIDFSSIDNVNDKDLLKLLNEAKDKKIDMEVFEDFKKDLAKAKTLLVIIDNCGEIVIDKLLIKEIQKAYPQIRVTAMVRGADVINDASRKDAKEVGLDEVCEVVDNGTAIPSTVLEKMPLENRAYLENADVILSKGQANAEKLLGCGLNIYYLLLCKCVHFSNLLNAEKFSGVLKKERA